MTHLLMERVAHQCARRVESMFLNTHMMQMRRFRVLTGPSRCSLEGSGCSYTHAAGDGFINTHMFRGRILTSIRHHDYVWV